MSQISNKYSPTNMLTLPQNQNSEHVVSRLKTLPFLKN